MTKLICAIDTSDLENAKYLVTTLSPYIDVVKLGLEFFISCGINGVEQIAKLNKPIFLDLKLHDIPNTVESALKILKKLPIMMLTIHISGGNMMLQRAKNILSDTSIKLVGVTMLTSLSEVDLRNFHIVENISDYVKNLAIFGKDNNLDGVVCSLLESNTIKKNCGLNFITITPGIVINENNDHKRAVSIDDIKNYNTDYIVVGRAITDANNKIKIAEYINSLLKAI